MPKTKLQKHISRKKNGKEYAKFVVVIPSNLIKQLQWVAGDQLIPSVDGRVLRIKKAR